MLIDVDVSRFGLDLPALYKAGLENDRSGTFPVEGVQQLRRTRLMSAAAGGPAGSPISDRQLASVAAELGSACLSTALIWSMHSQQLRVLSRYLPGGDFERVAAQQELVASVTTERGKGGDIFRAKQPLIRCGTQLQLVRDAPIVSYGGEADAFLILMKASESASELEPQLVFCRRSDGKAEVTGDWQAMGVRGTRSVPMHFDLQITEQQLLKGLHRDILLRHYVPLGQILWSSSWYGAAEGLLQRFLHSHARRQSLGRLLDSELMVSRIAHLRIKLVAVAALIEKALDAYDKNQKEESSGALEVRVMYFNALKVFASESCVEVARGVQALAGMAGYLASEEPQIEKCLRDLMSAPLMVNNDLLLSSIGVTEIDQVRKRRSKQF